MRVSRALAWTAAGAATMWLSSLLLSGTVLWRTFTYSSFEVVRPTDPTKIHRVVASISTARSRSTAIALRSALSTSEFLTNAHVCANVPLKGAAIYLSGKRYVALSMKVSTASDLCLVKVEGVTGVGVELASELPANGEPLLTGGYPMGMPLLTQRGFASSAFENEELGKVLLTSALVQPGQSGSPVFDAEGRLVGIMQAFRSRTPFDSIGFGLAVPLGTIRMFLDNEGGLPWTEVPRALSGP